LRLVVDVEPVDEEERYAAEHVAGDRADADKQRPEQQDARAVRYLECVCICVLSIAAYSSESI
jgi:hypothetical protein